MLSTLLVLAFAPAAFAADPVMCGTAAAPVACTADDDKDKDGFYAGALAPAKADCVDDPADNAWAFSIKPGAKLLLGDGAAVDSDCDPAVNGKDEADELAAVMVALGGSESKKWLAYEAVINLCVTDARELNEEDDFVFGYKPGVGYTCLFKKGADYEGWTFDRESGVKDRSVTVEARRRIAGDKRGVESIGTRGTPAVAAVPATKDTPAIPAIPAVPGTGLYGEIERLEALIAASDKATAARLETQKVEIQKIIDQHEPRLQAVERELYGIPGYGGGLVDRVDALESSGPIFEVGVSGLLYGGRSLLEYEGGPVVRSGIGGGVAFVATTGYAWEGHQLYLDLAFSQGSEGSGDSSLPLSLGFASVGHQWTVGNIAAGLEGIIYVSSMGNPLDSTVSSWGVGGGGKGAYYFPDTPLAIVTRVDIVADSYGTNSVFNSGAGVVGTLGISLGPVR